jgi:hypothetical protein
MKNQPEDVAPVGGANELDDQQMVDQYMTSLIQRLHDSRGAESSNSAPSSDGKQPSSSASAVLRPMPLRKPADSLARPGLAQSQVPDAAADSGPSRTARPPESASDLLALRELANEHARHAIQVNTREQNLRGATAKLMVGGLAIAVSFLLLRMWKLEEPLALAAAATSIIVAVRWSWQFWMLTASR